MERRIPWVVDGVLWVTADGAGIKVDSAAWHTWLAEDTTMSFSYVHPRGRLTVRKERRQRGGQYWIAYYRRAGTLRKTYLGKSPDLTLDQLETVATAPSDSGGPTSRRTTHPRIPLADAGRPLVLLETKLSVPPIRPGLVPRPRLTKRLDRALTCPLTLVTAPAGYGKTTLVSDWVRHTDIGAAWVALDERDNDPIRFWTYLVAAVERLMPGVGETSLAMLRGPRGQGDLAATVLPLLLNDLTRVPAPGVLVLDDYHVVNSPAIHDTLSRFIDHLPPHIHVLIASRADPMVPLPRLRAGGQLVEVRAADLRFSPDEARAFLTGTMGIDLAADDVVALTTQMEGWAAGLQLAALSLQADVPASAPITTVDGTHRAFADYLAVEALGRQPDAVRSFLLATCPLDRLEASLCDALTGRSDGREMLERLERANIFLQPLDSGRRWYRYHQVFAGFLRARLRDIDPGRLPALHARAAAWYERAGNVDEAIAHAQAAGDHADTARLIERGADATLARGEVQTVHGWIAALPAGVVRARPRLCCALAWTLLLMNRVADADGYVEDAATALPRDSNADNEELSGEIVALRATCAALHGDRARVMDLAEQLRQGLPMDRTRDPDLRAVRALTLGGMYAMGDDLDAADRAFGEAFTLSRAAGNGVVAVIAACNHVDVRLQQGHLRAAAATCHEALQLSMRRDGRPMPLAGGPHIYLSGLAYEWDDLDGARRHAEDGIALCREWGNVLFLDGGHLALARALQGSGDRSAAHAALDAAVDLMEAHDVAHGRALLAAASARLWLAEGDPDAAERCLMDAGWGGVAAWEDAHDDLCLSVARVRLVQGRGGEMIGEMERRLSAARAGGRMGAVVELLLVRALISASHDDVPAALIAIDEALTLGSTHGYRRLFLDEGKPLATLLRQIRPRRATAGYAASLLAALDAGLAADETLQRPPFEPLSAREHDVLRLIAAGQSTDEIAGRLFIAVSTVKSHIHHLLDKLDARSRTAAVARARDHGLL